MVPYAHNGKMCSKEETITQNTDDSLKCNFDQKSQTPKNSNPIYVKFKNRQNISVLLEIRIVVTFME